MSYIIIISVGTTATDTDIIIAAATFAGSIAISFYSHCYDWLLLLLFKCDFNVIIFTGTTTGAFTATVVIIGHCTHTVNSIGATLTCTGVSKCFTTVYT